MFPGMEGSLEASILPLTRGEGDGIEAIICDRKRSCPCLAFCA